jgi:tetratricopeptide (TPR) repeat protein
MRLTFPGRYDSAQFSKLDFHDSSIPQFLNSSIPQSDTKGRETRARSSSWYRIAKCVSAFCVALCVFGCSTESYRMKRAERLYREGQIYLAKGDQEKAMAKFQHSIEMAELIGYKPGIAHNLNEMAIICTTKGEFDKARELLDDSLAIYRDLNMAPEISKTLNNIALTYVKGREFQEAVDKYEELIAWDQKTNNELGVGLTLYNEGVVLQNHLGRIEESRKKYREALEIFKKLGEQQYIELVEKSLAKSTSQ